MSIRDYRTFQIFTIAFNQTAKRRSGKILLQKIIFPELTVSVGYTKFRPGFLFIPEKEAMKWIEFSGLVITPLDTNLVAAIIGMYFGGSLVKR